MRAYTVATAAVALNVDAKWVDNVLSHHAVAGVSQSRQGIARRLTAEAVCVLELALRLTRGFGIPVRSALGISQTLLEGGAASVAIDDCDLRVDGGAIRASIAVRLAEAVEIAPVPRRGRPRIG